jgi:hypothetical protein
MNKRIWLWVLLIVIIALGAYYIGKRAKKDDTTATTPTPQQTTPTSTIVSTTSTLRTPANLDIAFDPVYVKRTITGVWKSTEDGKFTRTFTTDGKIMDFYEGDETAAVQGIWSIADKATKQFIGLPAESLAETTVIKVAFGEDGVMYFGVDELTDTNLSLTNLSGRGNVLSFTKLK